MRHISIKILTVLFIFFIATQILAGERDYAVPHSPEPGTRYSREDANQHYFQGKEFYSQGRYTEARNEFEKALDSVSPPPTGVTESAHKTPESILAPTTSTAQPKEKLIKKKKETEQTEITKAPVPAPAAETKETEENEYHIDIGDVLDIFVWRIPDLSRPEVIVRPDGKISFPLISDIKAEGLTLTQLNGVVTEKLKTYVKEPRVSVMIRRFGEQANKVIVLGEVLSPGIYKFGNPPTVTEVIAASGGYTKYAVLNSIMIIRGGVETKPEVTRVNIAQVLKSGRLTENISLRPNDIVYVPRSFIGKVNTFLELIQPAISEYMQTLDARHFHNIMHRNAS